jgi:hypothetical protein
METTHRQFTRKNRRRFCIRLAQFGFAAFLNPQLFGRRIKGEGVLISGQLRTGCWEPVIRAKLIMSDADWVAWAQFFSRPLNAEPDQRNPASANLSKGSFRTS